MGLTITSQVPERKRSLALYLEALAVHEGNEALYKFGLCHGELLAVGS
jgi:hypothetical protein